MSAPHRSLTPLLPMTLRYLSVVVFVTAIGAGLLGLRQQQLNDKHAIAESHTQMKNDREAIKDLQVRIAQRTTPEALLEAIDRAGLPLEPITSAVDSDADADQINATSDLTADGTADATPAATTEPADG